MVEIAPAKVNPIADGERAAAPSLPGATYTLLVAELELVERPTGATEAEKSRLALIDTSKLSIIERLAGKGPIYTIVNEFSTRDTGGFSRESMLFG